MTTTVYFDLDGTLLDYSSSFADLFARAVPVDADDEMVETYSKQVLEALGGVEEHPYRRAFAVVCEEHDLDLDPGTLAATYVEIEAAATRLSPRVRRLVSAVSARHRTGILTNGDGRMQRRKIDVHDLGEHFDAILVSNEVGSRKPDRDIFEEAKRRLPADTFVYVGDSYEEDILPAAEVGFETVYVGNDRRSDAVVSARGSEELASVLLALFD